MGRWRLLVAGAMLPLLGALMASCDTQQHAKDEQGQAVLRRGLAGQPGSLDPHKAEDAFSFDVLRDLYEGLTASDPGGEVVPAAASGWTVSDDGKTYRFELRPDARWSNGDAVLARHFVAGFRRAVDPATASGGADLLRAIANAPLILAGEAAPETLAVRAISDRELEIKLSHPVAYFPDILANTVASPVHDSSVAAGGGFSRPGETVSNGAFRLAGIVPGASIRLVRNEHYWAASSVRFDEVRYELVPDAASEYARFRAGDLDVTNDVPGQRFEELARDPDSGLQYRPALATFYFSFNTTAGPLSKSASLREALSLAVDRDAITRLVTRAGQTPAYSLVPEGVWAYEPASHEWRDLSADERYARARRLLAAAGYSRERPLRLRLLYNENDLIQRVCLAIASTWKQELGVETELIQMEFRAYLAARAEPDGWDLVRVGWSADYNDASSFLDTLTAGSPQNFGRWSDAGYEHLLQEAAAETDVARRRELLQRAERRMLDQYPVMPVYFYVTRRLVQPWIDAPPINPMNRNYSRQFGISD